MTTESELRRCGAPARAIQEIVTVSVKEIVNQSPEGFKKTYQLLLERLGEGFLLSMIGERGTGKTLMSVRLMGHVMGSGKQVLYAPLTLFLMRMKSTYNKNSTETELDVMKDFQTPHLLVLDEMGKRAETDWEDRLIFHLLDSRYQDMKDTLLLSNQTREAFEQSIGQSLVSRMVETGGIVECKWPSFRNPK